MKRLENKIWQIDPTGKSSNKRIGFAAAWKLCAKRDLSSMTRNLPDSVAIFSTEISAGQAHLKGVLVQASESSDRGITLARNSAIDLLMRLTCQSQIKEAMRVSDISSTQEVGAFGFVVQNENIDSKIEKVEAILGDISDRDDLLLDMSNAKAEYLKKLHSIPQSFTDSQVVDFLLEKSSLLCFSK